MAFCARCGPGKKSVLVITLHCTCAVEQAAVKFYISSTDTL